MAIKRPSNGQLKIEELTDAQLVEACLDGQEIAWEALINRYSPLIYTIPLRFGFSYSIADEIFQEICLFLLEKLETLRDHQRLHPWLVTVTRRLCLQRIRKVKQTESIDLLDLPNQNNGSMIESLMILEQQEQVHQAIENLDPRCRQLINALFFDEEKPSYVTLAEDLNISVGSVGPIRARCLEKLRAELTNLEQPVSNGIHQEHGEL